VTSDVFSAYPAGGSNGTITRSDTSNLADILERVLDKGVVVAGDIVVSLVDVELLTIRLRLLIASVDKAKEMGINWWESDPWLTTGDGGRSPSSELSERLERLESTVERMAGAIEGRARR
jgi:hypothetical protein